MVDALLLQNFGIALALGALIGLEREYANYKKKGHEYAGIRTFPLISLLGALAALLGKAVSPWILITSIAIMGILSIVAFYAENVTQRHHTGATTEIAGFLTFFVGVLAFYNQAVLATALAVVMTVLLHARTFLHHFAKKMSAVELADTLKFAVVAFVILPFLPNQDFGPHGIFNPYVIWLMVVFISGIGFFGYILLKWFGERGITLAGILGGLVSSTAVTSSFAARSKKEKTVYEALALGVILANGIMFIRILVEVFVLNRELFMQMLIPMLSLAAVTAIFSFFLWEKAKKVKGKIELGSPFTIGPALKFGVFFAVILALVKLADVYLSSKGVYLVSIISGFADVDAITVSLSNLAGKSLAMETARNGIIIAALTNVAVKGGIAYWFGGKKFGHIILTLYAGLLVLGGVLLFIL